MFAVVYFDFFFFLFVKFNNKFKALFFIVNDLEVMAVTSQGKLDRGPIDLDLL